MCNIVVDFDDCGLDTLPTLLRLHKERMPDYALPEGFLTPANAPALPAILEEGTYMLHTPIKKGFEDVLRRLKGLGHNIYACTHRGFHPKGKEYTERLIAPMRDVFDDVFYLDPKVDRDKTVFLSKTFKDQYYLIDDNPGFGSEFASARVVLFEARWNKSVKGCVTIKDWNFLEVFGALALTQSKLLKVPFDGNFEHE